MLVKSLECQYYVSVVVSLLKAVLGSRIIKTTGEQRRLENKGNSVAEGLNITVTHHFDISIGPESVILFFHAIVLFAIILKLKYMRILTFLIVNITLTSELISFIL